ncbi:type II toxin-antitoxin system PemK/MazF family toxin [Aequorivita marisscotiae]|uniref:mRNA interferase n=1 Tax=Aequorivita marisscotiae TaxID=3040348 RepID=A0ABY8KXJ1_9FLAO|nr:type II toxin-antitoxin system PemK/MazF family toxin [Aequorivita sp. Ant34-E75]WGF92920.1 type II toxin-antitoxin system PemK/MazF family toxin [Aequorivita sp. Ant34-E75]
MRQGEIWNVYFDPVKGSEQSGNRPAVIISGNALNMHLDVIIVCPLSSSVHHFKGNPILRPNPENGLTSISEVMVFHVRSISKERFKKKVGYIDKAYISEIKNTLNDLLKY